MAAPVELVQRAAFVVVDLLPAGAEVHEADGDDLVLVGGAVEQVLHVRDRGGGEGLREGEQLTHGDAVRGLRAEVVESLLELVGHAGERADVPRHLSRTDRAPGTGRSGCALHGAVTIVPM